MQARAGEGVQILRSILAGGDYLRAAPRDRGLRRRRGGLLLGGDVVRHLTLPTREGSVTLEARRIATIEPRGEAACRIHMRQANVSDAFADKFTHEGYGASEKHNVFDVKWPADELRAAIARMDYGDHFDPLNLETLEDE